MLSYIIAGGTLIDGTDRPPVERSAIWVENGRIRDVGPVEKMAGWPRLVTLDASGAFLIPGLMNANVHLLCDVRLEVLAHFYGRYDDLIAEAAQIALQNGVTTVFDTWGPRRYLTAVRDRINAGHIPGSRMFCAGNIIGFDGPFSHDFSHRTLEVASSAFASEINATWVEEVGRDLMWLSPAEVDRAVRRYISRGVDFIKYASNEHFGDSAGAFLAFSPEAQRAIVEAGHEAGLTVQAHTMSIEGLRLAVEAGCDLIQHANLTGPVVIPKSTLELMARRRTSAVLFPATKSGFEWIMTNTSATNRIAWSASDDNVRNLIDSGVRLLLGTDGGLFAPDIATDPQWKHSWIRMPESENLSSLATGHFVWLKAMEQKQCPPLKMLQAATRNIAEAYGKQAELGTLEPGKAADIVVLSKNPLEAADNYRAIEKVIKDGVIVDRASLPQQPTLTRTWHGR